MTRFRSLIALVFLTALPVIAAPPLKLATLAPQGSSFHQILLQMAESSRNAGGPDLRVYPGTMGSETEIIRRMRLGQLHAGMLTVSGLAEIDPNVTALQYMPMMFRDLSEVDYVRRKLEPMLNERLRQKGFVVLFWGDAGWVRFFSRTAARTPEEFKKQKVFALSDDNQQVDLMNRLGYHPVPLQYGDVLTGLQTGMIDAVPTAPVAANAGQFNTVAKNMLELPWVPLVGATIITQKAWDKLTQAEREALMKAASEAGGQIEARGRKESDDAVQAMRKRGMVVIPIDAQLRKQWEDMAETIYPQIRGRLVPADMFDRVRQLLAEYRSQNEPKGKRK